MYTVSSVAGGFKRSFQARPARNYCSVVLPELKDRSELPFSLCSTSAGYRNVTAESVLTEPSTSTMYLIRVASGCSVVVHVYGIVGYISAKALWSKLRCESEHKLQTTQQASAL